MSPKGTLYLIPTTLSDDSTNQSTTVYIKNLLIQIKEYIVEEEKSARKFIKSIDPSIVQNELLLLRYGKHERNEDMGKFFKGLEQGKAVGLMSEAGCPAIADPGSEIVAEAHRRGIKVVPLVGPSSIILALMASGFNGQNFTFWGYLPIDKNDRKKKVKELENLSERYNQTQIFIETPFRNHQLMSDLLLNCNQYTKLCVARDVTGENEQIISCTIAEWRKKEYDFNKIPCIFLLLKSS